MNQVTMRRVAGAVLAIAFSFTGGLAHSQHDGTSPPARAVELSAILDAWVQHSAEIKTLSATVHRKDKRPGFGTAEYRYEIRWNDSGQAVLNIECLVGKDKTDFRKRVVWTGREVWVYLAYNKEISVRTMDQIGGYEDFRDDVMNSWAGRWMGNEIDLIFPPLTNLKDVDPLPFLVGIKDTVAQKQFRFELLDASDPNRFVIRATPLGTEPKSLFNDILITLDRERFLPVAVTYQRGWRGRDSRQFTLVEAKLNPAIAADTFVPRKPEGWEIKRESAAQ